MESEKINRLGSGDEEDFVMNARSGETLVTTCPVRSVDMKIASNAWRDRYNKHGMVNTVRTGRHGIADRARP